MTEEIAVQIASGRHFSMPERIEMGLWPHPPIAYEWLSAALTAELMRMRFFPAGSGDEGRAQESLVIEREGSRFVGRSVVLSPLNPNVVEKNVERTFGSPDGRSVWLEPPAGCKEGERVDYREDPGPCGDGVAETTDAS